MYLILSARFLSIELGFFDVEYWIMLLIILNYKYLSKISLDYWR